MRLIVKCEHGVLYIYVCVCVCVMSSSKWRQQGTLLEEAVCFTRCLRLLHCHSTTH